MIKQHMLYDEDCLKKEIQKQIDTMQPDGGFVVQDLTFDDGVWMVRVAPRTNEVSAGKSAEILASVEEKILFNQGINTHITASGVLPTEDTRSR